MAVDSRVLIWVLMELLLILRSSQLFWNQKFLLAEISLNSVTVSKDASPKTEKTGTSSFQFLDMVVIDAVTDHKTSSAKASVRPLSKVRNWKEDSKLN